MPGASCPPPTVPPLYLPGPLGQVAGKQMPTNLEPLLRGGGKSDQHLCPQRHQLRCFRPWSSWGTKPSALGRNMWSCESCLVSMAAGGIEVGLRLGHRAALLKLFPPRHVHAAGAAHWCWEIPVLPTPCDALCPAKPLSHAGYFSSSVPHGRPGMWTGPSGVGGRQAPAPTAFLSPWAAASYPTPTPELQGSQFLALQLCPQPRLAVA